MRNTLAVADIGGSALAIPYYEFFGVLPAACLMTCLLSYLLRRFSVKSVFLFMLMGFIMFFLGFGVVGYPMIGRTYGKAYCMTFYVIAELWKPALIQILFWGLINLNVQQKLSKTIYPLLLFGSCCGGIISGPLTRLCASKWLWNYYPLSRSHWFHSFIFLNIFVFLIGAFAALLYYKLCRSFSQTRPTALFASDTTLFEALRSCWSFKTLRLFAWVVIADYIAYSLGEIIFLEILKEKFSNPIDYCLYQGQLTFFSSGLTLISAIFITPLCLRRYRWVISAMILPIVLLIIEGAFFIFLRAENLSSSLFGWAHHEWLGVVVVLGSVQFCVCRSLKYTLFDGSKELAFAALSQAEQVSGKLIVDGICSRLGRGSGCVVNLGLIAYSGGVLASSFLTGLVAISIVISWIFATAQIGAHIDPRKASLAK